MKWYVRKFKSINLISSNLFYIYNIISHCLQMHTLTVCVILLWLFLCILWILFCVSFLHLQHFVWVRTFFEHHINIDLKKIFILFYFFTNDWCFYLLESLMSAAPDHHKAAWCTQHKASFRHLKVTSMKVPEESLLYYHFLNILCTV